MADTKKRILCVEDDEDHCELVALLLSDYEVTAANSALEGLLMAHQEPLTSTC